MLRGLLRNTMISTFRPFHQCLLPSRLPLIRNPLPWRARFTRVLPNASVQTRIEVDFETLLPVWNECFLYTHVPHRSRHHLYVSTNLRHHVDHHLSLYPTPSSHFHLNTLAVGSLRDLPLWTSWTRTTSTTTPRRIFSSATSSSHIATAYTVQRYSSATTVNFSIIDTYSPPKCFCSLVGYPKFYFKTRSKSTHYQTDDS